MGDVIKLGEKREKSNDNEVPPTDAKNRETESSKLFEEIAAKNTEKKKRMDEERKKANKDVIRSYRLK